MQFKSAIAPGADIPPIRRNVRDVPIGDIGLLLTVMNDLWIMMKQQTAKPVLG
jgi:hypothetical protein